MEQHIAFGRLLHRLRKARDLTQAALAQQSYCALDTIKKIESGVRRPSRAMAAQFADCLGLAGPERAAFLQTARAEAPVDQREGDVPQQTVAASYHNLPAQPTALIGRAHEVAQVCALLQTPDVRLLTLTGPGGVGKTRLALQVALELSDDFPDGIWFVNLAPISDADLVAGVIAQTLGVREMAGRPLLDSLQNYLRDKHALLLLDNFEQVIAAATLVADLLSAAAPLTVLVTSREVLHLRGEKELPVPPLALPPPTNNRPFDAAQGRRPTTDDHTADRHDVITQYEAVRLFIARAQDVQHGFALTDASAPAVAEICRRLDGLPLAIELAAARIKLLDPLALLGQLGDQLTLLTHGARDLPARQQTLRHTIDWSYNLLDANEQRLFQQLGVFVGGCTLAAIVAVQNAECKVQSSEVNSAELLTLNSKLLTLLAALVDKSLLRREDGIDGDSRFVMLETIHAYALERLVASGEEAALRQRHAHYYLTLAERAEPLLHSAEQRAWLDLLEADHDNLRAALAWSQASADTAGVGLRLAAALWLFWEYGGHLSEGREQLTRMLAHAQATAPTTARARALFVLAILAGIQGDFAPARAHLAESHTLSHALGYTQGIAYALYGQGFVAWLQGEIPTARACQTESLAIFRELSQRWPIALTALALGDLDVLMGAYERGESLLEESLQLYRTLGDQLMYSHALLSLGYAARLQGHNARATTYYAESLALFQNQKNTWGIAAVHLGLGDQAQAEGDAPQAAAYFAESLVHYREIGHREGMLLCLAGLAWAAGGLGQPMRAARLFSATDSLRASLGIGKSEPPAERQIYEASMASIRAQLDQATFAATWAAGQALTLEQAITEALT